MPDDNIGVTAGTPTAPESGLGSGSADTGGLNGATNPSVPGATGTDPGASAQPVVAENAGSVDAGAEALSVTEEELQQAPEQWRDKFTSLFKGYKSLEADHKPIKLWVDQRGGLDAIQSDVQMLDKLYSANLEDRRQFYEGLYNDTPAFDRFMTDITTDPTVQQTVLKNIDPQVLMGYVEKAGLLPQGSTAHVDPAVLAQIPQDLQEVFRGLPPAVQEDYALMNADLRNWNLRRDAQLHNSQKAEQQRQQREQQQQQHQRAQQAHEQKSTVYKDVRSIVQQALAQVFPGNDQASQFVLNATEAALYSSEEGVALWNELESYIDSGQTRALREKLPLMIAKAKAEATKTAQWLNERESKARQFDELMKFGENYDEIIKYLGRVRGGQKQPSPGVTPQPQNGHGGPKPELAGQYDPANVVSYFPRN